MFNLELMMSWVKSRIAERTSWDGATIIGLSVLVLAAAANNKLLLLAAPYCC